MHTLLIHPGAARELNEVVAWCRDRFGRRVSLPRFPCRLIYRIEGAQVVVLALHHQRRRPGYWVGRR